MRFRRPGTFPQSTYPTGGRMTSSSDVLDEAQKQSRSDDTAPSATLGGERKRSIEQITLLLFIVVPFLALLAAVPLAWGWG